MTKIVKATVYEQTPDPYMPPPTIAVVKFDDPSYVLMDRRRIKRERAKAIRKWKRQRRVT